jgi:hypothetical protein
VDLFEISFKHPRVLPDEIAKMSASFRLIRSFLVELSLERHKIHDGSKNRASECYCTDIDHDALVISASDGASTVLCHINVLRLVQSRPFDAVKSAKSGRSSQAPNETGLI